MFFYSTQYFSNKTTILFLKKPYFICKCLIDGPKHYQNLMLQCKNKKSNYKCTKMTCVFEKTSFISTPPSTSKITT
jgi:hypothetical protein